MECDGTQDSKIWLCAIVRQYRISYLVRESPAQSIEKARIETLEKEKRLNSEHGQAHLVSHTQKLHGIMRNKGAERYFNRKQGILGVRHWESENEVHSIQQARSQKIVDFARQALKTSSQ